MQKKIGLTASLLLMTIVLAACGTDKPITADSEGFWDSFFVYPMSWLITQVSDFTGGHYGWGIVIVTIVIRLVILPLALKAQKSSRAMQKLRPQMQEIQKRLKDTQDMQKKQEIQREMLGLYQKNGVNPAAGCLPMLIQIPIVMALYFAIIRTEAIGKGPESEFLWFNLGQTDYVLPVIAAITTFISVSMSMSQMPANPLGEDMPNPMSILKWVFPVLVIAAGVTLPSALALYWVIGNLFMIAQTYFVVIRPNQRGEAAEHDKK